MSNPLNTLSTLPHRLGVAGPARVRASEGTGAHFPNGSVASPPARRLILLVCPILAVGVLALGGACAQAASLPVIHEFKKEWTGYGFSETLTVGSNGDVYVGDRAMPAEVDRLTPGGGPADFSCGAVCSEYVSGNGAGDKITGIGATGTGTLTLFDRGTGTLEGASGKGTFTAGSNVLTAVATTVGAFAVGQAIENRPGGETECILLGTTIVAVGEHTITLSAAPVCTLSKSIEFEAGSKEVTGLTTTTGAFAAGQEVNGAGIQAATTITEVSAHSLKLSKVPTQPGSHVELTVGSREITGVTTTTGALNPGQQISAPGLPVGTTIVAVKAGGVLEVSRGATASESASLAAHQPFGLVSNVAVDDATGDIYVSTTFTVDVFSGTGEYRFQLTGTCETPGESAVEPGACPHSKLIPFHTGTVSGLAIDQSAVNLHDGDLYVAVGERSNNEVDIFSAATGEFVSTLASGGPLDGGSLSVAIDEMTEDVYVGRNGNEAGGGGRVEVFSSVGALEAEWSGAGTPDKTFGLPIRVGIDPSSGRVYVVAPADHFVPGSKESAVDEFEASSTSEEYLGQITGTPTESFPEDDPKAVAIAPPGSPSAGDVFIGNFIGFTYSVVDEYGPDVNIPAVLTGEASEVKTLSATLNGKVSTGAESEGAATCRFVWGKTQALEENPVPCVQSPVKGEEVPVSAKLGEGQKLEPDTEYYFRLQATYEKDKAANPGTDSRAKCEGQGQVDACFTTAGPGVRNESALDVASTSAVLQASIDPNNGPRSASPGSRESYYFQYATGPVAGCGPGSCAAVPAPPGASLGEGEAPVEVQQNVTGLSPATTYHYRVLAVYEPSSGVVQEFSFGESSLTTQGSAGPLLPDDRGWELVSPPELQGAQFEGLNHEPGPEGGAIQAAANGDAISYLADAPIESDGEGNANDDQVLSVRGVEGWSSREIAPPHAAATRASIGRGNEYRLFSEDLSTALVQPFGPFDPSLSPAASEQGVFLRTDFPAGQPTALCSESCYRPLVTGCPKAGVPCPPAVQALADVPPGTEFEGEKPCISAFVCGPYFVGATPDLSHVVLTGIPPLQAGQKAAGLDEWSADAPPHEALQPVSLLPDGEAVEGLFAAISTDGSRVVWAPEHGADGELYLRDLSDHETVRLGAEGEVVDFQAASAEGSRILFSERGTLSLYECQPRQGVSGKLECPPIKLAGGMTALENATAGAVLGASPDLGYLYISSTEAIPGAAPNRAGQTPRPGDANLYLDREGAFTFIADVPNPLNARVSPNGQWLTFMSSLPLTGYDNRDAVSGQPDQEVYLYHAGEGGEAGSLVCASCNPTGARPHGVDFASISGSSLVAMKGLYGSISAELPGPTSVEQGDAPTQSRYLSDSGRLFFNSDDALVPRDSDGTWDVYEYEPPGVGSCATQEPSYAAAAAGCISLISSGTSSEESVFLEASESGDDVFFLTRARLVPRDDDTSYNVYDARVGGGEVQAPKPVECQGDACQSFVEAPNDATPDSLTFQGPGNSVGGTSSAPPPVTKQTVKCKKPKKLSHGKCAKSKKKAKKAKKAKRASRDRRASR